MRRIAAGVVILLLFPLGLLFARDVAVVVRDGDVGTALPGAVVRSWDGDEFTADEDGRVVITVPDDRQVTVMAAYPGYDTIRLAIPPRGDVFTAALRLRGVMENRELVVEGSNRVPGVPVDQSAGRSVTIDGELLARTAETGLIEDVMTSIQLLPGVGYTAFFDAMPSIRGGEPGDLMAVLDGFYIENPYHWGGGFSIFDPRMIESARLSHGVFSSRYGHTISGLLELSSKRPSVDAAELDIGLSTNAADLSLSLPLFGKGGVMLMGKITWWQPFIELAHLFMPISRNVKQAPWIGSGALSANYRFTPNFEWTLNGYFGADGIGFAYETPVEEDYMTGTNAMEHFFDNRIGFLNTGIVFNPLNTMVLKASLGAGINETNANIERKDELTIGGFPVTEEETHHRTDRTIHAQGRVDFDWDLGLGFLVAVGAQERYSLWTFDREDTPQAATTVNVHNNGFFTSAYTLVEYTAPGNRFGAELGLRMDQLSILGEDGFALHAAPVFDPRLNLDFGVLRNTDTAFLESLDITVGTGLFSSVDESLHFLGTENTGTDLVLTPAQSWGSLIGVNLGFAQGLSLSIEGYYKYVFNRAYTFQDAGETVYRLNGEGHIWGFDLLLQKTESRYWDGWISYSFNDVQYRDPDNVPADRRVKGNETWGDDWYYPEFHRFHTLNLVVNIKPLRQFHIAARLGFTTGKPVQVIEAIEGAMVGGVTLYSPKYAEIRERNAFSMPLDLKFSWYLFDRKGKVSTEIYLGVENLLSPLLPSVKTIVVNPYTGAKESAGGMAVMSELAIPLPSFGVKWSY
ncbi:TonB-dependent receptor [Spirochaetia bacterium]|nr:TonB-dependent receptor [Spirochaetia bacterium]